MLLGILLEWLAYLECSAWRLQVAFKLDTSRRVRNNECHCCWLLIKLRTVSSQFFWRAGNRGTERKSANGSFVALSISNFKCQLENQALCPYLYPPSTPLPSTVLSIEPVHLSQRQWIPLPTFWQRPSHISQSAFGERRSDSCPQQCFSFFGRN